MRRKSFSPNVFTLKNFKSIEVFQEECSEYLHRPVADITVHLLCVVLPLSLLKYVCFRCRDTASTRTQHVSLWAVLSRSVESNSLRPHGLYPARLLCPWGSPGQNTGLGCHFLLQGIFSTQGSNPGLLHCRRILYQLSHKEAQEYWSGETIPSPGDLPNPGTKPGSPALPVDSLPAELPGKTYW